MPERLAAWHESEIRGWLEVPGSYTLGPDEIRIMLAEIDALRAENRELLLLLEASRQAARSADQEETDG